MFMSSEIKGTKIKENIQGRKGARNLRALSIEAVRLFLELTKKNEEYFLKKVRTSL